MRVEISVDTTPYAQARPRVVRGHAYEPKHITEYKRLIGEMGRLAMNGRPVFSNEMSVEIVIRRRYARTSRIFGDIDNHIKAVLDALNGVCYADDARVVELLARKETTTREGVDVVIRDLVSKKED